MEAEKILVELEEKEICKYGSLCKWSKNCMGIDSNRNHPMSCMLFEIKPATLIDLDNYNVPSEAKGKTILHG